MDKPYIDDWICTEECSYLGYDNTMIIIPFDKIFERDVPRSMCSFIVKKPSYVKHFDNICHYINYFIKFYDTDKEILLAYLKLKSIIDKENRVVGKKEMLNLIYKYFLTESVQNKVIKMVDENYIIDLTSPNTSKKYSESLEFTNEHGHIVMAISFSMRLIIPLVTHYLNKYKMLNPENLFYFFKELMFIYQGDVDIFNKLYRTVASKTNKDTTDHSLMWKHSAMFGNDIDIECIDRFFKQIIICDIFPTYLFNMKFVSLNKVTLEQQLKYLKLNEYKNSPIELNDIKDGEGLSKLDKYEMSVHKVDESIPILSDINTQGVISKLTDLTNIEIPEEEINFYLKHHQRTELQIELLNYYVAKYFGEYRDLNRMSKYNYMRLLVLTKRRLQAQGYNYLPQLLSGNIVGRINNRTIRNTKFLSRVAASELYQQLYNEKF